MGNILNREYNFSAWSFSKTKGIFMSASLDFKNVKIVYGRF